MADRIEIEVDGKTYRGEGLPPLGIGVGRQPVRHGGGGRETWPVVRFVEGRVAFAEPVTGETLEAVQSATVRLTQASGYSLTLLDARAEYAVRENESTGVISLKFVEGVSGRRPA